MSELLMRLRVTICNWRWWCVLPVAFVALPIALLLGVLRVVRDGIDWFIGKTERIGSVVFGGPIRRVTASFKRIRESANRQ